MFTGFIVLCVIAVVSLIFFRKLSAKRIQELKDIRAAKAAGASVAADAGTADAAE